MLRIGRRALLLTALLMLVAPPSALPDPSGTQADFDVDMGDFFFAPQVLRIRPGDRVTWTNVGEFNHSSTNNTPLVLWDSGVGPSGFSYSFQFHFPGTYLYHCTIHFDMTGLVSVVPRARPRQGPVGTVFTIQLATEDVPTRYVWDVQRKDPGGQFQDWIIGITDLSVTFDSSGQAAGQYQFRARLRRVRDNVSSLYSLPAPIVVTE